MSTLAGIFRSSRMKPRIRMDAVILALTLAFSLLLYFFPQMYSTNRIFDEILDFPGVILILKGIFIRMAARGHKLVHSHDGGGLVTTGLYAYVRNPMYLGTFLIGSGFVLIVWPWWTLLIFPVFFSLRFWPQVIREEHHLKNLFGKTFEDYCRRVPRFFPDFKGGFPNLKDCCPWEELWMTKEKRALWILVPIAFVLEIFQEQMVFHATAPVRVFALFLLGMAVFVTGLWLGYRGYRMTPTRQSGEGTHVRCYGKTPE